MNIKNLVEKRQETTNAVKNILISKLNLDKLSEEIPNDAILFGGGLGLDSIDALQLVVGIEADLNIKLPQDQFAILRSVNTIVDYILEIKEKPTLKDPSFQFNIDTLRFKNDYENIRTNMALSIRNDLAIYKLSGADALENLNKTIAGKVEFLYENSVLQTLLLNENGNISTYLEVANFDGYYLLMVPQNKFSQLEKLFSTFMGNFSVENISDVTHTIAVDGPNSMQMMEDVFGPDVIGITPNMIVQSEKEGNIFTIIRTNPTGEIGYLILFSGMSIEEFIEKITSLSEKTLPICDADVHQILRLEACTFEESHFVPNNESPLEAGLQWMIDIKKDNFIGKMPLKNKQENGIIKKLIPFYFSDDKTTINNNAKIVLDGKEIGYITVSAYSPSLGKRIGLAYVKTEFAWPGITLELADQPAIKILLTSVPFFLTKSHFVNM